MIELSKDAICCVFDAHARPDERAEDFERFSALGHFINTARPGKVVLGGDWWDFPSLSIYDGSRAVGGAGSNKRHSGKTILNDLRAGEDALKATLEAMRAENRRHIRARHRDRCYEPEIHFLGGNHEDRLNKIPTHIPELDGMLDSGIVDEFLHGQGIQTHRFLDNLQLSGINFRHYFESGVRGRAVPITQALNKLGRSAVWGHTHTFGHDTRVAADGQRMHAVCAGCFKPPRRCSEQEWSGIVVLNNPRDGDLDLLQISTNSLLRNYRLDTQKAA
ncbi:hypothetical protein BMI91_19580 [Thioclava sediminum]|uniref:Calcineurin-like phosphoesterase domain-containing protein n=1 Tax=Thioclava sediminum TaxID=1915319 RepID=A0ABX3MS03_9RHOB|nr:hypothetical protein [Thioclava sediminum]OOY22485.1 hypothetical protein BMI91_19580 [Thioclava sediminum]